MFVVNPKTDTPSLPFNVGNEHRQEASFGYYLLGDIVLEEEASVDQVHTDLSYDLAQIHTRDHLLKSTKEFGHKVNRGQTRRSKMCNFNYLICLD